MLNHIDLAGRLTNDPVYKEGDNYKLCRFSIACDRDYQQGETRKTDFIHCTAFRHSAEFIHNYFQKGDMIVLSGRLEIDKDQNDEKKSYTTVIVENAYFGGAKKDSSNSAKQNDSADESAERFHELNGDGDLPF